MAGGPSKVKPPNSHPANPIHKQATEAQGLAPKQTKPNTQTQPTDTSTQTQTQSKTEPVDSHHVRVRSLSIKKATTASMSSQACSPRKERTCPAALDMKLTIEPMSPGKREPNF